MGLKSKLKITYSWNSQEWFNTEGFINPNLLVLYCTPNLIYNLKPLAFPILHLFISIKKSSALFTTQALLIFSIVIYILILYFGSTCYCLMFIKLIFIPLKWFNYHSAELVERMNGRVEVKWNNLYGHEISKRKK